jgi:hypothetical protein
MGEQNSPIHMENMQLRRKIKDLTQTLSNLQREILFSQRGLDTMREKIQIDDSPEQDEVVSRLFFDEVCHNLQRSPNPPFFLPLIRLRFRLGVLLLVHLRERIRKDHLEIGLFLPWNELRRVKKS